MTDRSGYLFSYLDGTFPLGSIPLGAKTDFTSILKHPSQPFFVGSRRFIKDNISRTSLSPTIINFPLLAQRKSRDLAKLSSTSRELVWYILRVVKEMREVWYGSDSNTGAREFGPKWVQTLEAKQREDFGGMSCLLFRGILPLYFISRRGSEPYPGSNLPSYHWETFGIVIRFPRKR